MAKTTRFKNRRETDGRFAAGGEPGPGRPKGSRGKLSQQQLKDAREFFLPLLDNVKSIITKHFKNHKEAPDCATCRHYIGIVVEYVFGKAPQRVDVQLLEARAEAERIADELGLPDEQKRAAVAEVEAILRGQ